MSFSSIQEAKARLDVPALWHHFGFKGEPRKSCRCPFHDDRSASFSAFDDGQAWKCHAGCGGGDAVTFIERAAGLSQADACRKLVELAGGGSLRSQVSRRQPVAVAAPIALPPMREGTAGQLRALASLRRVSVEAVTLASGRSVLRFGEWKGREAWFVTDGTGRVAQARRLDGGTWAEIGGKKAWTICCEGQAKWSIGIREAGPFSVVALVEGGPDLLAAFHFIGCEEREADCSAVAMLGASLGIHPDALPLFAGKRVRIFGHADDPGDLAVQKWIVQLREAGAEVDAFSFQSLRRTDESAVGDLNDFTDLHADDFEEHRPTWGILPGKEVRP